MTHTPIILADDFEGWGKLLVVVIFAVIWGFGALSSMVKKANEQAKRKAALRPKPPAVPRAGVQYFQPIAPGAAKLPPTSREKAAMQKAAEQQARQRAAVASQQRATQAVKAPPPIPPTRPVAAAGSTPGVKPLTAASAAKAPTGGANASTIRRWLQPGTIRRQYILTELFQPALALREPRKPS